MTQEVTVSVEEKPSGSPEAGKSPSEASTAEGAPEVVAAAAAAVASTSAQVGQELGAIRSQLSNFQTTTEARLATMQERFEQVAGMVEEMNAIIEDQETSPGAPSSGEPGKPAGEMPPAPGTIEAPKELQTPPPAPLQAKRGIAARIAGFLAR